MIDNFLRLKGARIPDRGDASAVDTERDKREFLQLYLEQVYAATKAAGRAEIPVKTPARPMETVLVVDDDADLRNLVAKWLRTQGYEILAAANGFQALQLAERCPVRIDALITDIDMPYLQGTELAMRLTAKRPYLRVLLMSGGHYDAYDAPELLSPGSWFLEKPFTLAELGRKLRELLDPKNSFHALQDARIASTASAS